MTDASWENRGPDNCTKCGVACYSDELECPYSRNPYGPTPNGEAWCPLCIIEAGEVQDEQEYEDRERDWNARNGVIAP